MLNDWFKTLPAGLGAPAATAPLVEELRGQLGRAAHAQQASQHAMKARAAEVTAAHRLLETERQRNLELETQLQSANVAAAGVTRSTAPLPRKTPLIERRS